MSGREQNLIRKNILTDADRPNFYRVCYRPCCIKKVFGITNYTRSAPYKTENAHTAGMPKARGNAHANNSISATPFPSGVV